MEIREAQIEDILVGAPTLARQILQLAEDPMLLGRQLAIPSGRLDLLYTYRNEFLLLELKVTAFQERFIRQVLSYKDDLQGYQASGRLVQGNIQPYVLCTAATDDQLRIAQSRGVICSQYDPAHVLRFFYDNLRPIASFSEMKPIDIGIWNLHLIHELLYLLDSVHSVSELRRRTRNSDRTLYNKIKFATELRLVSWTPHSDHIALTAVGTQYAERRDPIFPHRLSEAQAELLRRFVMQNPYESPVVLGIAAVVESVFTLAKNTYPVPMAHLLQYFTFQAGKHFDWQTDKAKYSGTRMYSNYAVDLGLLAKSGETVYLTPEGFKFAIQMQLHKGLKMMDAMTIESSSGPTDRY